MGEAMVLIRTFRTEDEAAAAREELKASGIQSILMSEDPEQAPPAAGVHLAVHERDQNIAEAVLNAVLKAE